VYLLLPPKRHPHAQTGQEACHLTGIDFERFIVAWQLALNFDYGTESALYPPQTKGNTPSPTSREKSTPLSCLDPLVLTELSDSSFAHASALWLKNRLPMTLLS
jgi:hypothetical protein